MIKLYVTDVDGTLVKDGSSFCNPAYHTLVQELSEQGVIFMAASGRQYVSLKRMFAPVAERMAFISESGAVLWRHGIPEVLGRIDPATVNEIAADVQKLPNADLMMSGPFKSYVPVENSEMHKWLVEGYGYDIEVVKNWTFPEEESFVKAAVYHREVESLADGWFVKKWNQKLHCCYSGVMWLDCMIPGISKGDALRKFQEELGIRREETAVFADNQNDIEMMRCSTHSFAVDTAREEVKAVADAVIPNFTQDGVLQKMKELARADGLTIS